MFTFNRGAPRLQPGNTIAPRHSAASESCRMGRYPAEIMRLCGQEVGVGISLKPSEQRFQFSITEAEAVNDFCPAKRGALRRRYQVAHDLSHRWWVSPAHDCGEQFRRKPALLLPRVSAPEPRFAQNLEFPRLQDLIGRLVNYVNMRLTPARAR